MSRDSTSFVSFCPSKSSVSVMTIDGTSMPLVGVDSVSTQNLSLSNVYCIPALSLNLISVVQLCDAGYLVQFSTACHVQKPHSQKLIGIIDTRDYMFWTISKDQMLQLLMLIYHPFV